MDGDTQQTSVTTRFLGQIQSLARRFLLATLVLIGAMCGVLAVSFHYYLEIAHRLLIGAALAQGGPWSKVLVVLVPAASFALIAAVIRRFAPRAVGANLARVRIAYNRDPGLLGIRSVVTTFIATPLSLGAGAPLGPEGPIVVITSGASIFAARVLKLPRRLVRGMIPVGVAAGIAAIFNTPITGVVFALEEVIGTAERGLLGGVIVGAVAAAVVERSLLGGRALLAAPGASWSEPRELIGFAIVGIAAGLFSGYAISIIHRIKRFWAAKTPSIVIRAATGGLLIGGLGLLSPSIFGVGYGSVSTWLHGGGTASETGLAFGVKTVAFVVASSCGILGGTFAPSLFMGAALGAAIGHSAAMIFPASHIDPKAYALLGMGSFFAGLLRSPIAAVLIVIELTRDYDLVLPLMLAVSLSVAVSRRISQLSIVERQMVDEGYVEQGESTDPLEGLKVSDVMGSSPLTVRAGMTLLECVRMLAGSRHHLYPVVDAEDRLVGLLSRDVLEEHAREGMMERDVAEIARPAPLVAVAGDRMLDLIDQMRVQGVDRCPVVDGEMSNKVVGFVSPSDMIRVRLSKSAATSDEPRFDIFS